MVAKGHAAYQPKMGRDKDGWVCVTFEIHFRVFVEKGSEGKQIEIFKDFVPIGIIEGDFMR